MACRHTSSAQRGASHGFGGERSLDIEQWSNRRRKQKKHMLVSCSVVFEETVHSFKTLETFEFFQGLSSLSLCLSSSFRLSCSALIFCVVIDSLSFGVIHSVCFVLACQRLKENKHPKQQQPPKTTSEINRKARKSDAWGGPGGSWGRSGDQVGSKGRPETKKRRKRTWRTPPPGTRLGSKF